MFIFLSFYLNADSTPIFVCIHLLQQAIVKSFGLLEWASFWGINISLKRNFQHKIINTQLETLCTFSNTITIHLQLWVMLRSFEARVSLKNLNWILACWLDGQRRPGFYLCTHLCFFNTQYLLLCSQEYFLAISSWYFWPAQPAL